MAPAASSSAARSASIHVITFTPTVRWSESCSDVSASWSQPRGRYSVSPARRVTSSTTAPGPPSSFE